MAPCHVLQTKAVPTFQNAAFNEAVHSTRRVGATNFCFQLQSKAAGAGSNHAKKNCCHFDITARCCLLMYSKWKRQQVVCAVSRFAFTVDICSHLKNSLKQSTRVIHAVTTTCLRCKYSFELQRIQAEDPHVEHAMTLAFTVEGFFFFS